ncbi:hypothetical protein EX30DRAFT_342279 [Ascodesmis nigricans]|uniref:N-acetyltransferase domain-containing protein n=1 Tax=Ascodesmis nigricans TaxID=341454 RepID=A0A4S2MT60_9PEZI|nr:hypothetical protein EX30DRAFT_342279 [Ascodesmis nigricans]
MATPLPTTAPPLPSPTIPHTQIHLRPGLPTDLPQCHAIFSHWVLQGASTMSHTVPTLREFSEEIEMCWTNNYPFIVAVYSGYEPDASSMKVGEKEKEKETALVLGYLFTVPIFQEQGHRIQLVEQGTFIHPALRKSGIGSRLTALNLNLLKNPERYTHPVPLPSTSTSLCPNAAPVKAKYPELDPTTYHLFRGSILRKPGVMIRRTVIDEEGIGKGKSRFYEKFGFRQLDILEGAGVKGGKKWDIKLWVLQLEEWDEVRAEFRGKAGAKL